MIHETVSLKKFTKLQPGDVIDIIAPSSACPVEDISAIQALITSLGLHYRIPENIFGKNLFSANSDEVRFKHLQEALQSDSKAIWCVRGGYGATRLIPYLAQLTPISLVKMLIGSSDITALHTYLQMHWQWPTIHGPSLHTAAIKKVSEESIAILKSILFQTTDAVHYKNLIPLNSYATHDQTISANIIGGNLSLIQASLGTFWQLNAQHKILLIEETNERGYRLDRMLTHLQQANIFNDIAAVLLGDFTGGQEDNGTSLVTDAVKQFAAHCQKPVIQINGVGHGFVNNPILLGSPVTLQLGKTPSLHFQI